MMTTMKHLKLFAYLGLSLTQMAYTGTLFEDGYIIQASCYAALSFAYLIEMYKSNRK
jgi:hypothetical protein